MPSIMAVPYPTRGHVLVEANFADVPGATNLCVEAVTGFGTSGEARRPLHPYVSYNTSGCQTLSCGQAIFWDTEIPCDTATVYCATAVNAAGAVITQPAAPFIADSFTRVVANGWGVADSGQTWVATGGAAADFSVTGSRGQQALTTTAVQRICTISQLRSNLDALVAIEPTVVALTAAIQSRITMRRDAVANNDYRVTLQFNTAGTMTLILQLNMGGVFTTLASVPLSFGYTAATLMQLRARIWGNQIMARAWDATTPEPAAWDFTVTDNAITAAGWVELRSQRLAGNTNGTVNLRFDNFLVTDVCADPAPVTQCTTAVTIACDGCFRLGNPVRPCDDIKVCLCADGVGCGGVGGVFFVGMTPDTRVANSGSMVPVNDQYPVVTSRRRMKPASNLTVMATSFTARDQLINLLDPGEPLLLRTTASFGIGNRYLDVGDATESYGLADMTVQPRLMQLPNSEVRAPVGPTLGVCGARVKDLCDVYPTWDAIVAAGLTYADLLRGNASATPALLASWADINAQNASWNALLIAEPDWNDVLDGD